MLVMGLTGHLRLLMDNPPWAVAPHDTFFVFVMAVLLLHAYMTIVYREHRPLLRATFVDRRVPIEFVGQYTPEWYGELQGRPSKR